jgi:hypothetical protein
MGFVFASLHILPNEKIGMTLCNLLKEAKQATQPVSLLGVIKEPVCEFGIGTL